MGVGSKGGIQSGGSVASARADQGRTKTEGSRLSCWPVAGGASGGNRPFVLGVQPFGYPWLGSDARVSPVFPGDSLATHRGRDGTLSSLQLCTFQSGPWLL